MRKNNAALIGLIILLILNGCALAPLFTREINFSHEELTARLNKRFPLEKNIADLLTVKLMRPRVSADIPGASTASAVKSDPTRLVVSVDLNVKLPLTNKSLWGTMSLSGVPRYDTGKRAIFLGDTKLERVRVEQMPDALSAALAKSASQIAKDYFEDKPIYTFNEADLSKYGQALNPSGLTRIEVRTEGLALILK